MGAEGSLPGLDLERLAEWLPGAVAGAAPGLGLTASLIAGGKSNLTYLIGDGAQSWILRRPPVGHLLATAHDMVREFTVMSALAPTAVPVPRMLALCRDEEVLGAPFYVMERVEGRPYRFVGEVAPLGPARTRAISEALVDTLAALHAVDPVAVGLAGFGRPEGFLSRQVSRWRKQFDAAQTRELPLVAQLHQQLAAEVPAGSATGIVHGDYRLDNVLIDDRDRLVAVIDWEMATLGDPLTDLALMLVYGRLSASGLGGDVADVASAPGFLSEAEIVERYAAASDRDLSGFGFYLALASFKLAGILEGIHYRYVNGQTVGEGFAGVGDSVNPLLESGIAAMKEYI